jgi:hypothetical protein
MRRGRIITRDGNEIPSGDSSLQPKARSRDLEESRQLELERRRKHGSETSAKESERKKL